MRRRAFTLVELLNVIAIIAILSAILWPAFKAARGAAFRFNAILSMKSLGSAVEMYMVDHDSTYPIAMSADGVFRTWFGEKTEGDEFDTKKGILSSYTNGRAARDLIHVAKNFLGDHSGFGYNWGYLGSDVNITLDYWGWPNCYRPARSSEVDNPKGTILFASSAVHSLPWWGGDGQKYDFGFIDPPKYWRGNPNVDFRHGDPTILDSKNQEVVQKGNGLFLFTSGRARTLSRKQLTDEMFYRSLPAEQK